MAGNGVALGQPQGPRNVEQITKAAQSYEYDADIPLKYWLRTAAAVLKEAETYYREGDEETTYFLLFRHAHLVLAQLAQHPQASDKATKPQQKEAEREVSKNLKMLDVLKPRINQRYDRYMQLMRERETRRNAQSRKLSHEEADRQNDLISRKDKAQRINAHEHKDLAVKIAQRETSRRAATRQPSSPQSSRDGDNLAQRLHAIRARVESDRQISSDMQQNPPANENSSYRYPSVPTQHLQQSTSPVVIQAPRITQMPSATSPPSLPPKPGQIGTGAPTRPEKVFSQPARPSTPEASYTFAPSAYLENGTPLRPLFLPPTLRTTFLRLAYKNTLANLETCAFLAGTLSSNAFFVSRLIVPAQTSTSDTCEMTNESQLFDYVDSEDLMILGWIHTHPTQTCFMSSRDLHTHAGYQMMLAESVAIVCAPSKGDTIHGGDWGVYRLTDPPGKKVILSCEKPGIFHPHDVDNIYTDALKPGHVVEVKGLDFEVVDLREK